jgi:hypothetical protein
MAWLLLAVVSVFRLCLFHGVDPGNGEKSSG